MGDQEIRDVVASIPSGLRMIIELLLRFPSLTNSYVALPTIAWRSKCKRHTHQLLMSVEPTPPNSEVIAACPELAARFDGDGRLYLSERIPVTRRRNPLRRLPPWPAPVFCTRGYESIVWVRTTGVRLCCWSEGVARTEAAQPAANSAGVRYPSEL